MKTTRLFLTLLIIPALLSGMDLDSSTYFSMKAREFRFINLDSIEFYAYKAKAYAIRSNDSNGLISFHNILGISLMERGQFDSALTHYSESSKLALMQEDSVQYARIIHHIGVVYKEKSNYEIAIDKLLTTLRLAEKFEITDLKAMSQMNLATVYGRLGDYSKQLQYAWESYKIAGNDGQLVNAKNGALIELGNAFINTGKLDSSIWAFKEALSLMETTGIRDGYSVALNNLGALYYFSAKYPMAIELFQKTVEVARDANDQQNEALGLMNIGDTYSTMGELAKADKYLQESLQIFLKIRHLHFIRDNYDYLANLERKKGNLDRTLKFTELKFAYKDSILNESTANKITELQTAFETEKKDQEIKTLKAESELHELQMFKTQLMIISIVVVAILLIIILSIFHRQRSLKLQAQLALEKEQLQKDRFKVVIETEENERKRVARELHDGLGQMLSTVRLFISDLGEANENPKINRSLKALDSTIDEVRNISHNMMPIKLMELGLGPAIHELVDRINESDKMVIKLNGDTNFLVSEAESIALYRSAQEVINNAIKYAKANEINVSINNKDGILSVSISDNGQGFNTENIAKSKGIGWSNIYSRMELSGGEVTVKSALGKGTLVELKIPLTLEVMRSAS